MEFPAVLIYYNYNGHLISGKLTGNIVKWYFWSESEVFTYYFPEGYLSHKTLLNGEDDNRLNIVEATLAAIDEVVEINQNQDQGRIHHQYPA